VAAFGIGDIFNELGQPNGNGNMPFPRNFDASVFALFADILGNPGLGTGVGDGSVLPPPGKNALATPQNFSPVVPIQ
jgi:hypothetical protein